MLYNYIKEHYKEAEPIFFSDLEREDITKNSAGGNYNDYRG